MAAPTLVYETNGSGFVEIKSDLHATDAYESGGNRIAWGSSAPDSGYWKQGDIIFDVAGSLRFCTVTGAPGTWVAAAGA